MFDIIYFIWKIFLIWSFPAIVAGILLLYIFDKDFLKHPTVGDIIAFCLITTIGGWVILVPICIISGFEALEATANSNWWNKKVK